MALITEIRKQFWFILVILGLALAAFIMMDAQSFGGGGGHQSALGSVAGQKIEYQEFQHAQGTMYSNSGQDQFVTRNAIWNHFVDKAVVEKETQALGITLTPDMLANMKEGPRLSPVVQGFFPGQNGQFDQARYNSFKAQYDAGELTQQARAQWEYLDNYIAKDYLQSQLTNIASKGVYTPTWMAEILSKDQKVTADFQVVKIPYSTIGDVEVSDAEMKAYLKENKAKYFNKKEMRSIKYLAFEAKATSEDSTKLFNKLAEVKADWAKSTIGDSLYVLDNDGFFPVAYTKEAGLDPAIKNVAYNMDVGEVYGPYLSQGAYNLAKLVDRKEIPDSVQSRHILIDNITTQEQAIGAKAKLDSLQNLLETGQANFADLAKDNSMDGSASLGGDLGMTAPDRMAGPFNDLIFYQAEPGKYYQIFTQFGLHLIEVTDRKFTSANRIGLRLVYIPMTIVPSKETQGNVLAKANELLTNAKTIADIEKYASENGMLMASALPVDKNSHTLTGLNPGQNSRDIVQWAFLESTEINELSPVVHIFDNETLYYNEKFVIAGLESIQPKGYLSLDQVRDEIRPLVINDKKVKSLDAKLAGQSLDQIASAYDTNVESIQGAKLNVAQVGQLGSEPSLVAYVWHSDLNKVSGPFAGQGGAYYVMPTAKNEPTEINDVGFYRSSGGAGIKASMNSQLLQSLKDANEIEDDRSTFF